MNEPNRSGDAAGQGLLSPVDRLTELLYGIILVLTFTGTVRVAAQGADDVRSTLWAAVGCSLAWGLVDGAMYVFSAVASRNRSYRLLRALREDPSAGRRRLAASMPSVVSEALTPAGWDTISAKLATFPVPSRARMRRVDLAGGVAIFGLANAALLPLAAPFVLIDDLALAQRVSNALALLLLFACGFSLAHYTGEEPLRVALRFTLFGVALIGVTIALGG